jgi:hypothetical protein
MGARPRPIGYAGPRKREPRKEWPAWLIVLVTATVMIGVIGGVFIYLLREPMPAPNWEPPPAPIQTPDLKVR